MIITLSPIRMDATLVVERAGDTLTLNDEILDFADLAEGDGRDTGSAWITGPVSRRHGQIHVLMLLPHGLDAPESVLFPAPVIDPPDGPVALPG